MKYTLFTIIFLALVGFNLEAKAEDINRKLHLESDLQWAQAEYSKFKDTLQQDGKFIAEVYITLLEKELSSSGDKEIIRAYDRLYELAKEEYSTSKNKQSTLWRVFHFDYSRIPLGIAQICRDSESLSTEEKATIIEKQRERSNDNRITKIIIDEIKKSQSYPKAIDYCLKEIEKGNEEMRFSLAWLRIEYQRLLVIEALNEKGIDNWMPELVKYDQLIQALSEAKANVERDPSTIRQYFVIFRSAFEHLHPDQETIDFFEYSLNKLQEIKSKDGDLIADLKKQLESIKEKVAR